jgi:thioester reductase-like protein
VRKPYFGLDEVTWHNLTEEVDTVVHLAADVKLFATYHDLKESQVEGTYNVLKFCSEGRPKTLHYASTLSVFVDADPLESWCRESDTRNGIIHLHGGYAQSKWVAEQLVLHARENGLRAAIHRLGLLSLNMETGVGPTNDWLTLALPGLIQQAPNDSLAFDLTPVDYAAKVMSEIIRKNFDGIFHIANPNPITQSRIASLVSAPSDMSNAAILAGRRTHRSLDLFKCSKVRFDMSHTNEVMADSGIEFPKISDDYLNQCLKHAEMTNQ